MPKNKKKDKKKKQSTSKSGRDAEIQRLRDENAQLRSKLEEIAEIAGDLSPRSALIANPFDEVEGPEDLEDFEGLPLLDPADSPEKAPKPRRRNSAARVKAG